MELLLFLPVPVIWRWCKVKGCWRFCNVPSELPLCLVPQSTGLAWCVCSFRLWASSSPTSLQSLPLPLPLPRLPPSLSFPCYSRRSWTWSCSWCGSAERATEIQCIIMLSENIMMETSQSLDITAGFYHFTLHPLVCSRCPFTADGEIQPLLVREILTWRHFAFNHSEGIFNDFLLSSFKPE